MNFDSLFEKAFCEVYLEGVGKYSDFMTEETLNYKNFTTPNFNLHDPQINLLNNLNLNSTLNNSFICKPPQFKNHPLFFKIKQLHSTFINKEFLEQLKNTDMIKNFDDALSIYIFSSWNFNSCKENLTNLKIALILREYLNFIGWDNLKIMADYQIVEFSEIIYEQDFTKITLGSYLPELLDDFLGVYLKDGCPDFDSSFSEVKEFVAELCNILYNEDLISFMVEPLEG
jgi:hypothetical protein